MLFYAITQLHSLYIFTQQPEQVSLGYSKEINKKRRVGESVK